MLLERKSGGKGYLFWWKGFVLDLGLDEKENESHIK